MEIPVTVIFFVSCFLALALIAVTCVVIDTAMDVKYYYHWKQNEFNNQMHNMVDDIVDEKVGEYIEDKTNLGGGI